MTSSSLRPIALLLLLLTVCYVQGDRPLAEIKVRSQDKPVLMRRITPTFDYKNLTHPTTPSFNFNVTTTPIDRETTQPTSVLSSTDTATTEPKTTTNPTITTTRILTTTTTEPTTTTTIPTTTISIPTTTTTIPTTTSSIPTTTTTISTTTSSIPTTTTTIPTTTSSIPTTTTTIPTTTSSIPTTTTTISTTTSSIPTTTTTIPTTTSSIPTTTTIEPTTITNRPTRKTTPSFPPFITTTPAETTVATTTTTTQITTTTTTEDTTTPGIPTATTNDKTTPNTETTTKTLDTTTTDDKTTTTTTDRPTTTTTDWTTTTTDVLTTTTTDVLTTTTIPVWTTTTTPDWTTTTTPDWTTTNPEDGSTSSEMTTTIAPDCEAGMEPVHGECAVCKIGYYKEYESRQKCTKCPAKWITQYPYRTSIKDCNITDCTLGTMTQIGYNVSSCVACPIGRYQDVKNARSCKTCPEGKTTIHNGTESIARCYGACTIHPNFCKGSGQCNYDIRIKSMRCDCTKTRTGLKCVTDRTSLGLIMIIVGGLLALLLLISIALASYGYKTRMAKRINKLLVAKFPSPPPQIPLGQTQGQPMRYIGFPGGPESRAAIWSRPESQRSLINGSVRGSEAGSIMSNFNDVHGTGNFNQMRGEISIASSVH